MEQSSCDGILYFLKFPLLGLIYLFVLAALRIIIKSLPDINRSSKNIELTDKRPKILGAESGAVPASKRADSVSAVMDAGKSRSSFEEFSEAQTVRLKESAQQSSVSKASASLSEMLTVSEIPACGKYYLEVLSGSGLDQKRFDLGSEVFILGRSKDCSVRLSDKFVSGHHARITLGPLGPVLEDLGSRNGTLFHDEPVVQPAVLDDGDQFVIGDYVFRCRKEMA